MKKKLLVSCFLLSCVNLLASGTLKEKVKTLEMVLETHITINKVEQKIKKNHKDIQKIETDLNNLHVIFEERNKGEKNEEDIRTAGCWLDEASADYSN